MRTIGLWAIATICVVSAVLAVQQSASIGAEPSASAAAGASIGTTNPSSAPATAPSTKPSIPIRYDTTRILGPLKADGTVDYLAALNEQCSKGVTKENNAAVLLLQVLDPSGEFSDLEGPLPSRTRNEVLRTLDIKLPDRGEYFHDFLAATTKPLDDPEKIFQRRATSQPWRADECPALAKWLKDNEVPLTKVIEASKRPRYYMPLVASGRGPQVASVLCPSLSAYRRAVIALAIRANLAIAEGRYEDAWSDAKACYRLSALIGQGPTLIDRLVGISWAWITDGVAVNLANAQGIPEQTLRGMIKDVAELPPAPATVSAMDAVERYFLLEYCQSLSRDPRQPDGTLDMVAMLRGMLGKNGDLDGTIAPLTTEEWAGIMGAVNQCYDEMVKAMIAPTFAERTKSLKVIEDKPGDAKSSLAARKKELLSDDPAVRARFVKDFLLSTLMPSFRNAQIAADKAAAKRELTTAALALAAYNCENKHYPEKLADLVPGYLKAIPADLFSGEALIYKVHEGGCVVYSVGENMKDDGGKDKEHGGDDIVVTVGRQ